MKVTLNSPKETPQDDMIFVVEYPATSRVKMRLSDAENEISNLEKNILLEQERVEELKTIVKEMRKALK